MFKSNERVCIFVDGENFRHTIMDLFDEFNPTDYLPKNAKWDLFFDSLVKDISADGGRVRTYWYVIDTIDFFPYRFPDVEQEPDKLKRLLSKDPRLENELAALAPEALKDRMKTMVGELLDRRRKMLNRFNGWKEVQNFISSQYRAIEFRRAGAIYYNLFDQSLGPEKAVDVKLATDMIVLRDIYDVAVIVSGDQDYVPAVQVVKDSGKRVVNVAFEMRSGGMLPSGASRLNQFTDWSHLITSQSFLTYLNFSTNPSREPAGHNDYQKR